MKNDYNPHEIEPRWQKVWDEKKTYSAILKPGKPKFYMLEMFPYPSGRIHMGHVRNYSIGDVITRYKMMNGHSVLHPMGWDAFGLPAEEAAIERDLHPAQWTYDNIAEMRTQLRKLGFAYDWDREVTTCRPEYYKWEQLVFIKAFEKDLVYRRSSLVNWSEALGTVLANEQVIDGRDYKLGQPVVQREMSQWFYMTTRFADDLLKGLDELAGAWPERVISEQKARIGRSEGTEIIFKLEKSAGGKDRLEVFTTRPDTLYGVTFMSLAAEHPLALELARGSKKEKEVGDFVHKVRNDIRRARASDDYEKEGVFTGAYCIHPLTGERIPVYIANFVLMDYGTGAVMAVPAHDQRDFEFARKYDIPLRVVIQPPGKTLRVEKMTEAYVEDGIQTASGQFDGIGNREGIKKITRYLQEKGLGGPTVSYRLRDWCISRQRYWGCPIPVVYCDKCGVVPVSEQDIPVTLPEDVNFSAGGSLLNRHEGFKNTHCPSCSGRAVRETDTFDTFVESSWYHLRYTSPRYKKGMVDPAGAGWNPVDQYVGGIEHAVGHLVYARFYQRLLKELGMVPDAVPHEPYARLLTQGMVVRETQYTEDENGLKAWHSPDEVKDGISLRNFLPVRTGRIQKMSKSLRNGVDPTAIIKKYGSDTARLFMLFASPPERDLEWKDEGVEGCFRFLKRVFRLVESKAGMLKDTEIYKKGALDLSDSAVSLRRVIHNTIRRVTEDIEQRYHFNTAIARIMELTTALSGFDAESDTDRAVLKEGLNNLILLLAPFAPHIAEEMWKLTGTGGLVLEQSWPVFDADAAVEESVEIAVQISGKLRARLQMPRGAPEEDVVNAALENPQVKKHLEDRTVIKKIHIPDKILNIVVRKK